MERKTMARWLIVFAFACFGLLWGVGSAHAEQTVQGSNSSDTSTAETGDAEGSNSTSFNAGPSSNGTTGANSQQLGQNSATVSQSGSAESGDPVAGAQVTGVVADDATVQNQNNATNPRAESGDAEVNNDVDEIFVGPSANTDSGTAQASQIGGNSADISQTGAAATGDAVAGSQVTGIVGSGEHTIQNQNSALCDAETCAESEQAEVNNDIDEVGLGPFADSDDGAAQAGQVGDNDATLTQSADAASGDALFGSQVAGVVGGSATVQQQNSSECAVLDDPCATTDDAEVLQEIDDLVVGPAVDASGGSAQATQNGDNVVDVLQDIEGTSGDALSGAQVTGAVGDQDGFLVVQNQQASEGDFATSGDANLQSEVVDVTVGPEADVADDAATVSQIGDNDVAIAQTQTGSTGDALAGAQVTGAVGYEDVTVQNQNTATNVEAESGEYDDQGDENNFIDEVFVGPSADDSEQASASQVGSNAVVIGQSVDAATGDAIAGGQVTGAVATGSEVTIQNQNTATDVFATSGELDDAQNEIDDLRVGPFADSTGVDEAAMATQNGDNLVDATMTVRARSGDAVGAAQVTGVVAGDGAVVTVQNQNTCAADVEEDCADVDSGDMDDAENDIDVDSIGPEAQADGDASASQVGDNALAVAQSAEGHSGDAVGGAQVTGVVAGNDSEVAVQNQNTAEFVDVSSGDVDDVDNDVQNLQAVGPSASSDGGNASAEQVGDNAADFSQTGVASSGDAVGGAQVSGVVAGSNSEVTVQVNNTCTGDPCADVDTGDIGDDAFENNIDNGQNVIGPYADADGGDNAQASQIGDNDAAVAQTLIGETGDAVGGSQVNGVVAGAGSDVTVQATNSSELADVDSGDVLEAENDLDLEIGPVAEDAAVAQAEQIGDNSLAFSQDITVSTGDAVAGAQVTGIVGPEDATTQVSNTDNGSDATSGDLEEVLNEASGSISPTADGDDATAQQSGDSGFVGSQTLSTGSGDAVAGSQVSGDVGTSDAATEPEVIGLSG